MHLCTLVFIYSYIAFYIHISLYHLYIISFMRFYQDLAINVLSIFLSCMLLLIHIFIYVPIIHVHVLIPMLCHILLISIVLIIYAFLSCVPSMFHLIPFGMSIIYPYHIRCIYISFFIYFSFTFMFMFMFMFIFQFVFMCHIIFMFSCSSMNLLYLIIGIIPIDSSKFKLWHFHAN